jgi:hypothetical protein
MRFQLHQFVTCQPGEVRGSLAIGQLLSPAAHVPGLELWNVACTPWSGHSFAS